MIEWEMGVFGNQRRERWTGEECQGIDPVNGRLVGQKGMEFCEKRRAKAKPLISVSMDDREWALVALKKSLRV
jgi:hypothetical protein